MPDVRRPARQHADGDERGSMAVEVVLLVPVLMLMMMFVIACGRYVAFQGDIEAAARDAAREASYADSASEASGAAARMAHAALDDNTRCGTVSVRYVPQDQVTVHMNCSVSYGQLGLYGLPGSKQMTAEASAPLEEYRSYD